MHRKRAGELRRRDAAPAIDLLQALKRTAASFSSRQVSGRYAAPVRGTLGEDLGVPYVGVVRASWQGLRWHRRWALGERRVGWNQVRSCTVGPARPPPSPSRPTSPSNPIRCHHPDPRPSARPPDGLTDDRQARGIGQSSPGGVPGR
jgi:hypothetical protein